MSKESIVLGIVFIFTMGIILIAIGVQGSTEKQQQRQQLIEQTQIETRCTERGGRMIESSCYEEEKLSEIEVKM